MKNNDEWLSQNNVDFLEWISTKLEHNKLPEPKNEDAQNLCKLMSKKRNISMNSLYIKKQLWNSLPTLI